MLQCENQEISKDYLKEVASASRVSSNGHTQRSRVLDQVIAALPAELAAAVATAGIDGGKLTIGAVSAAWATRLRYATDILRQRVSSALGVEISSVRIKVTAAARTESSR